MQPLEDFDVYLLKNKNKRLKQPLSSLWFHIPVTTASMGLKTAKQDPAFKEEREKQNSISALL